jgi:hypothetical protein
LIIELEIPLLLIIAGEPIKDGIPAVSPAEARREALKNFLLEKVFSFFIALKYLDSVLFRWMFYAEKLIIAKQK